MNEAQVKQEELLYILKVAFIEIRASSSLQAAQKIADVFHTLPMSLIGCSTSDDYDAVFMELMRRATRWGLDDYLKGLKSSAEKAIAKIHSD